MSWTYCRRVRYYETDRMGVVHHSNYLRFLEDARMDWISAKIMSYREMEKMGIIIPAVSAEEHFKGFLRFDDPFSVEVRLVEYTGARIGFVYEIRNTDTGEVCYTGKSQHYFSPDGNQPGLEYGPMSIKRKFPELHRKFLEMLEQDK
ncbi:MAG: acyl-CoA thioesterase [Oscillospiraceae bacterium]|jgi:acyl-CoA thioester hydrolase|nr:acyl-CoA thioesterase [Oscillospiraceae bacterium]